MTRFGIQALTKTVSRWRQWPGCANPECRGNPIKQAMSKRHFGVLLAQEWFCGTECFEQGARKKIRELLASRYRPERPTPLRMPLGLLLLSRGILTHEQLKVALDSQRTTGSNFGDAVQELGFATAQQVTAAVAAQWACPVFSLGERPPVTEVRIPRRLIEVYGMLPVHYSEMGRRLMVAFVTRVQHHVLYTIEHMTQCTTTPCFITAGDYRRGMESWSFVSPENDLTFDRANSTGEIARMVRSYVNQAGAEMAQFGVCRDYLWARVKGRQEIDLLFRLGDN